MNKLLSGRRVLVVEDEMLILMIIEDMLADLGCDSVTAAATVDQALALIDAQVFDAAMLDMNLNGNKSHPWPTRSLRAACRSSSRPATRHDMRDGYRDRPVLKKPFPYEELVEIFTRLLSHRDRVVGRVRCAIWSNGVERWEAEDRITD